MSTPLWGGNSPAGPQSKQTRNPTERGWGPQTPSLPASVRRQTPGLQLLNCPPLSGHLNWGPRESHDQVSQHTCATAASARCTHNTHRAVPTHSKCSVLAAIDRQLGSPVTRWHLCRLGLAHSERVQGLPVPGAQPAGGHGGGKVRGCTSQASELTPCHTPRPLQRACLDPRSRDLAPWWVWTVRRAGPPGALPRARWRPSGDLAARPRWHGQLG